MGKKATLTFHGWSSPNFPDELKLLCLETYWFSICPGSPVDERTHTMLVNRHLVPLVQAMGAIAQEAYYKTMGFDLTISEGEHIGYLRYPAYGHWVRCLCITCVITIHPHSRPTEEGSLEPWLRTPLRWLLRSKKTLDSANIDDGHREKLLHDNDVDTRWHATFPNLRIFNPTIHVHKEICKKRRCLRSNRRCTTDCIDTRNLSGLRKALENAELGVKAKFTALG
jgi:hypothetical protein